MQEFCLLAQDMDNSSIEMKQIMNSIVGNVAAGMILALIGIGSVTVIKYSQSYNPRKKWKFLMIISFFGWLITGVMTTTYIENTAHTSSLGEAFMWVWGALFVWGFLGNWVNK